MPLCKDLCYTYCRFSSVERKRRTMAFPSLPFCSLVRWFCAAERCWVGVWVCSSSIQAAAASSWICCSPSSSLLSGDCLFFCGCVAWQRMGCLASGAARARPPPALPRLREVASQHRAQPAYPDFGEHCTSFLSTCPNPPPLLWAGEGEASLH